MKTIKAFLLGAVALSALSIQALAEAALGGYCPVCYIAADKAAIGTDKITAEFMDQTYYFVSEDAKAAFESEPKKFLPAYDGKCAYGMSLGKEFASDPTQFSVVDGVIYLNSSAETKKQFDTDPQKFIKAANEKFAMLLKEAATKEAK